MVDYIINLLSSTSTVFTTNGLGTLSDPVSCIVNELMNGEYELEMEYPTNGMHYGDIQLRRIIVAKPNPYATPQAFRIYAISKPIDRIVMINAQHISYDLSGYADVPFTATSLQNAFVKMKSSSVPANPFTFTAMTEKVGALKTTVPVSVRSILGINVLEQYGGEYEFDNYSIIHRAQRGSTRGVSIRYGKNLTDIKQEENCSAISTAIYPYWYKESTSTKGVVTSTLVTLPERYVNAVGSYDFVRVLPVDFTYNWEVKPTEAGLRTVANAYMVTNKIGIPTVSISVAFELLSQSEEYKNFAMLERVELGDYVNVEFPELGVSAVARCIQTVYNVITNKYDKIELGDTKSNIASTIVDNNKAAVKETAIIKTKFSAEVDTIKIGLADIDDALIGTASIEYLDANYIDANEIAAQYLDAQEIQAEYAHITTGVIDNATIDVAKVNNLNAEYAHITNGVIDNATIDIADIGDLTADFAHITDGIIDNATIDVAKVNSLDTNYAHLVNAYIDVAQIKNASITDVMIDRGTANKLKIVTADIVDGNITNAKIGNATIQGAKIADAAIGTAKIALGAITSALISNAAIGTTQIADGSITDAKIVGLTANKITAGTIDASDISVINLHADNITVGTINGTQIAQNTITGGNIASGTITADEIKANTITAAEIASGTITGNEIKLGSIAANRLNTTSHQIY